MNRLAQIALAAGITSLLSTSMPLAAEAPQPGLFATPFTTPTTIDWRLEVEHEGTTLTIAGPEGVVLQRSFGTGESPVFSLSAAARTLPDGAYTWQLTAIPRLDPAAREALRRERASGAETAAPHAGASRRQSGHFRITGGTIVTGDAVEATARKTTVPAPTPKDFVIADDLIVQFSACIGLDCVDGESFGFDTIRLKENNTRLKFEDTSAAGFPNHDWQLTVNDSVAGGAEKFSIEDVTAATIPFTLTGSAPTHSMFVDGAGRLGLGTATPVLDVHVLSGNTPALRLEQDGSSGFAPYTWDIAGNEAGYFVRDVTAGSRLPFRILPNAASNSLVIAGSSNVGVGTLAPTQKLEVAAGDLKVGKTTGGTTSLFLENTGATPASWILRANGATGGFTITQGGVSPFRINTGALANALTITSTGVDVLGTLRVGGVAMMVPDYVFEPTYQLLPIEKQGEYMLTNKHLPAVGKAEHDTEGRAVIDLGRNQMGMLEELEKAHLYIQQLARQNAELEARLAKLEAANK